MVPGAGRPRIQRDPVSDGGGPLGSATGHTGILRHIVGGRGAPLSFNRPSCPVTGPRGLTRDPSSVSADPAEGAPTKRSG